jgi:hypothetical protein
MNRFWTAEKEEFLKSNYSIIPMADMKKYFGIDRDATIRNKANRLGLSRNDRHFWTREEEKYLIDNYDTKSIDDLCIDLKIDSKRAVWDKSSELGLKKKNWWTEDEILLLKEKYSLSTEKELKILFPDRDEQNVRDKATYLGLIKDIYWKEGDIEIIKDKYPETHINEIIKIFPKRKKYSINYIAQKIGIKKKNMTVATRIFNPNMDKLENWNSDLAYMLGLFTADGNLYIRENVGYIINIRLKLTDGEILDKLCNIFGGRNFSGISNIKEKGRRRKSYYRGWALSGRDVVEVFEKHGIKERKTFRTVIPVGMPDEYFKDFLRGYFDGDGSTCQSGYIYRFILTGHDIFLKNMRDKIECLYGIVTGQDVRKQSKANCYDLNYNRKEEIEKIFNLIYYDGCLKIERKYEKFKNMVELI